MTQPTAIISGAAQGIGRATAKRLAEKNHQVALFDINKDLVEKTAQDLTEQGFKAKAYAVDCTNNQAVKDAVENVSKDLSAPTALINNLGWSGSSFFEEEDEAYWDKVIALNLKAPLHLTQAVLPYMKEQNTGHIVCLASDAGRVGQMQGVVYSACKGGVIAFVKGLAREVARYKINVNCVCPGPTETSLYESAINDRIKKAFTQIIPMKRIAQPEEIAAMVAFLASDEASYVTGQVVSVSGGLTMAG